jgi:hypothetical protein
MQRTIPEADWKRFRALHKAALERFSQRILSEVERVAADTERSAHERYLDIYKLLQRRDREMAETFDDPRRSMAVIQLMWIKALDLLTPEDLADFSAETREIVEHLSGD